VRQILAENTLVPQNKMEQTEQVEQNFWFKDLVFSCIGFFIDWCTEAFTVKNPVKTLIFR